MILHEFVRSENDLLYKNLESENTRRQIQFLETMVDVAVDVNRTFLSHNLIKALNYHAITCLHVSAGEYRPCDVSEYTEILKRANEIVDDRAPLKEIIDQLLPLSNLIGSLLEKQINSAIE